MSGSPNIDAILARFPKTRPKMSAMAAATHESILRANRERASALGKVSEKLESWMHLQAAERDLLPAAHRLLEIGAGTLNHVKYEQQDVIYDAVEPLEWLYSERPERARVRRVAADIDAVSATEGYDRIISIAALEHLTDLPRAVARAGVLLRPGGLFRACIPSEGGLLWELSWRISFALAHKLRTGGDWSEHMRYEHVNTAPEIIDIIRHFFAQIEIRRFPLPFHHASLYAAVEARIPRLDACRGYLARRASGRPHG